MKTRNISSWFLTLLGLILCVPAYAQIDLPPLSPEAFVQQKVGFGTVEITYSRPSMRSRVIFGELVPFGKVWRTGANASTKISFSENMTLENQKVPAGQYALYTIPGEEDWTIILSNNIGLWGAYGYVESDDFLRVKVKSIKSDYHFETFTIDVGELTQTGATLQLMWENTVVRVNLGTKADEQILAQIEDKLENPMVHLGNTYFGAAAYYVRTHRDMDKALEWVEKAIEINGKQSSFLLLKAEIMAEKGDYRKAITIGQEAGDLAAEKGDEANTSRVKKNIEKWKQMMRSN